MDYYLEHGSHHSIEGMVEGMKIIKEKSDKLTREMWVTQTDKDWLKQLCVSVPGEPCYVSAIWGIKVYASDLIPKNMCKVVANDGTVSWIKLREDSNEEKSNQEESRQV
jgi:hypothetical protein